MENYQVTETLNIQPPASIYGTFSRYSYKAWYAIAEFVDNSTASFYKNEKSLKFYKEDHLRVDIEYDSKNNILRVIDNAFGMEIDDFKRAILLNSRPENNDGRNEFGMGLKTSASWFGKVWSVTSTKLGSTNKYTAIVDIPKLEKEHKNDIEILKTNCNSVEHGTVIEIRDLTKKLDGSRTIGKIKDILRSMYRRDFASGKVTITYNNQILSFTKYNVLTSGGKEWQKNLDFYFTFDGQIHHITGFVGLLGEGKNNDGGSYPKAGFALFRRDRVVLGSEGEYYKPLEIFRQAQSRISLNLFGELNLDDFPINQAKDGFVWDNGLEEAFVDALKIQIADYIKMADKPKVVKSDDFDPSNEKEIKDTKKETQNSLNKLNKNYKELESQKTDYVNKTQDEIDFENAFLKEEETEETIYESSKTKYTIPYGITEETIYVTWSNAGNAYWYSFDKDNNEIKINIGHPFFQPFCSSSDFRNVLNKFVIAIYLAGKRAESTSAVDGYAFVDDINNEVNDILKKLAK